MSLSPDKSAFLRDKAKQIRRHICTMTHLACSGHPGGSLSAADIITALYFEVMRFRADEPEWPERDRFVLSKGHAAPALYAALAEAGFFPVKYLKTLRQLGSSLQGHPDRLSLPGIEVSTGSLGQGLAMANGLALARRLDKGHHHIYVLIGDGESQAGMVWEAAMAAAHWKIDGLTAILDYNKLQIDGPVKEIMSIEPVKDRWAAFGWNVLEIDGHDLDQIIDALARSKNTKGRPTMIIANTIKGKGVSFMEGNLCFHGAAPNAKEVEAALKELA